MLSLLNGCEPVYEELPGWKQDIANVKSFDEFPTQAKDYLKRCSDLVETPIELVSVGAERSQTVWV